MGNTQEVNGSRFVRLLDTRTSPSAMQPAKALSPIWAVADGTVTDCRATAPEKARVAILVSVVGS